MKHTVQELELKNGARGLLIDVPEANVMSYQIQFRAGNRYVARDDIYETAHIMEHMAFGSNAKFASATDFSADFEKNGAYHNAYTGDIGMVYLSDCAEFEWERILDLQRIAITTPKFTAEELNAEGGNVHEELTGFLSSNPRMLWQRVAQAAGDPIKPYKDRIKTIATITTDDIWAHYKATHTLNNMRFVMAGPMAGKKRRIAEMLESWKLGAGQRLEVPKDVLHGADPVLVKRSEVPNLLFGMGFFMNRSISDTELDAMAALDHILTGTLHSRILGTARSKGLVYGMWSDTTAYDYMSEWVFGGQVSLDKADKLFDIIVAELKRVLDGQLTQKEVDAAHMYALGKHLMAAQTVAQISNWYSGRYFFDGEVDNFDRRPRAIKATTAEKMADMARQFISEDCFVIGGLGSADAELLNKLQAKVKSLIAKV